MFRKILIASRGEIACRIARTCRRLGVASATVHTAADRDALHVREVGESLLLEGGGDADGYLDIEAVLAAARACGAEAVHPGIGFLAENAAFAKAVEKAGLAFVGPRADTMARFGDKLAAKTEAEAAGLPVLPGPGQGFDDPAKLEAALRDVELPVLLKALYGGGGRGVRVVRDASRAAGDIASAMREATNAFGRPDLMIERFLDGAIHVEVQLAGDGAGGVVHLFERECSLQRRFQKIVEESPAARLPDGLRERLWADACRLGAHARIRNLATIEFLVTAGAHYFLECNPRLQVEHTVTELVTGRDLVELQLRIAAEERLPLAQEQITLSGHAVQARVYAEDPAAEFAPSAGTVLRAEFPLEPVRVDAGIVSGSEIGHRYDPLVAKLVVREDSRQAALRALAGAVAETAVLGVATNLPFLAALLAHPAVAAGKTDIGFIERDWPALSRAMHAPPDVPAVAACLVAASARGSGSSDPWSRLEGFTGWRLSDGEDAPPRKPAFLLRTGSETHEVAVGPAAPDGTLRLRIDGEPVTLRAVPVGGDTWQVALDGRAMTVRAALAGGTVYLQGPFGSATVAVAPYLTASEARAVASGHLLSPMMGRIIKLNVAIGETVRAEDVLAVQESMKMEFSIRAPWDGVVTELVCRENEMMERHSHMITLEPLERSGED